MCGLYSLPCNHKVNSPLDNDDPEMVKPGQALHPGRRGELGKGRLNALVWQAVFTGLGADFTGTPMSNQLRPQERVS